MSENNCENIFRLSAILYKDKNYNVKRETIIRKIIESIFIKKNDKVKVIEAIKFCENNYSLLLGEEEMLSVIKSNPNSFLINFNGGDTIYSFKLTDKRFKTVSEFNSLGVDEYIIRFTTQERFDITGNEVMDIIHKYLYDTFTSNLEAYYIALNNTKTKTMVDIDNVKFSEDEKNIINRFLNFEDSEKDISIFNLINLSLEYCILTGNASGLSMQGISNKEFYLDTNIVYRAIGINGEERKELTLRFLNICLEHKIELKITVYTEEEFKKSLEFHVKQIDKYKGAYTNQSLYKKYNNGQNIFNKYCEWRCGRVNFDVKMFEHYIKAEYRDFIKNSKIVIDYADVLDLKNESIAQKIEELSVSIGTFKQRSYESSDQIDAENVLFIRNKRSRNKNINNNNVMGIKEFFISTDQKLISWEQHYMKNGQPVTFLPSQWLSIILRFGTRTNDDFKSFVSFLNMKNNTSETSVENLNIILDSINELTHDISLQKCLAEEIIENNVIDIINKDGENIKNAVKVFAETQFDRLIYTAEEETSAALQEKNYIVEENITLVKDFDKIIGKNLILGKEIELNKFESLKKDTEIKFYKNKIKSEYIKKRLFIWRRNNLSSCIPIIIFTIVLWVFHVVAINSSFNFVTKLYKWAADKKQNEAIVRVICQILSIPGLWYSIVKCISLFNKNSKNYINKVKIIEEEYNSKYPNKY
ncbi:hypothetical protein [Clostridium estertheticum]|uniref:hypothetical protein n=1 Tax=Clostridium estertheticum TaxID=238834 RepID=UPI001C7DF8DE|nr:hypothetical protein [Clostridium estertheticum]MBX4272073.1 hypothetical protein [Clostridium estertheticum]WLC82431.1 hypothetical protein KTC98_23935 [Clostridium estertheticum]